MKPGEVIRSWMESQDMSEGELSRLSKVPQPTIHRIITGESKDPRRGNIERIAKVFGKTSEDVYSGELKLTTHKASVAAGRAPTVNELKEAIESMSLDERKALLRILIDTLG